MFITGTIILWAVTATLTLGDIFGVDVNLGDSSVAAIIAAVASVMNAYLLRGARRSQRDIMHSQRKVRSDVADVKSMQEQTATLTELSEKREGHIRELRDITKHLDETARRLRDDHGE